MNSRRISTAELATQMPREKKQSAAKGFDRFQLSILFLLAASNLLSAVTFACIVPFFPTEAKEKGMSISQIGLVIGIYQLCTFAISPILGKYMIVLRATRVFIGGLSITALCTVLLGFSHFLPFGAPFFAGVLCLRIGQSLGNSAFSTSSWAIIGILFPDRIAMLTGILEVTYGLGFTVGPILGSVLHELGGFGLPLYAVGLCYVSVIFPSALLFRMGFRFSEGNDEQRRESEVPSVLKLLMIPDLFLAIVSLFLCCVCWCFYEPSLTDYLSTFDVPGWSPSMLAGLLMSLVSFSYLIFAPIWGFLVDRYFGNHSAHIMLLGSIGLSSVGLLMGPSPLLGLPKSLFITGLSFVLLGLFGAIAYVPIFKWCIDAAKQKGFDAPSPAICGCISGCIISAISFGAFIATTLGGIAAQNFGLPWTGTCVAGILQIFAVVQVAYRILTMHKFSKVSNLNIQNA